MAPVRRKYNLSSTLPVFLYRTVMNALLSFYLVSSNFNPAALTLRRYHYCVSASIREYWQSPHSYDEVAPIAKELNGKVGTVHACGIAKRSRVRTPINSASSQYSERDTVHRRDTLCLDLRGRCCRHWARRVQRVAEVAYHFARK
jgi:hypothetical protein